MNIKELESDLNLTFHDALLREISTNFVARTADFILDVCVGDPESKSELPVFSGSFAEQVAAFEQDLIRQALVETNGVQRRAADLLGMTERHLRYKLQKYGMKD